MTEPRDQSSAATEDALRKALQAAYLELKKHDAEYHHRTPINVNSMIVDALALTGDAAQPTPMQRPEVYDSNGREVYRSAAPRGWLYTLRKIESYSPTRLPHCIALGWHETPLYEDANANPASRSTATATAIAGDDRESMEARPLKVASPEAGSPPQCSAATGDEILYAPLAKDGEFTARPLYPNDEIDRLRANVEYWRLAAERRDERRERTGLDIPEAQTLDAPDLPDEPQTASDSDYIEKLKTDVAFCREAMRHADIDLSMVLPLVNADMQKEIRKTLARIDEAKIRSLSLSCPAPQAASNREVGK